MSDCLFCKIAAGEIPSNKVYEDDTVYAFYDIDPQAPTHFLVIPKVHIRSCGEITPENAAVVAHCFEVISQVAKELSITDFRVVSNCGPQAGQSVPHLHSHVLAGRDMTWPPGRCRYRVCTTPFLAKSVGVPLRLPANRFAGFAGRRFKRDLAQERSARFFFLLDLTYLAK